MSFWRTYYHLVWATKKREHLITAEIERHLFPYLIRKASELGVYVYAIGGWYDHVHVVGSIPPRIAVAKTVKHLKGSSSHYINQMISPFAWQRGYGVLTLGELQRPKAVAYVQNQKEHHEQQSTNAWLERYTEFDEGPPDVGILIDAVPSVLREAEVIYDILGESPF